MMNLGHVLRLLITALATISVAAAQPPATGPDDTGTDARTGATPMPGDGEYVQRPSLPGSRIERLIETVRFLAGEECEGRRTGTLGRDAARDWLVEQLEAAGVAELNPGRGYTSGFAVTKGIAVIGRPQVALGGRKLEWGTDYIVAPFSGGGVAERVPLVFAGYGIVAPELDWNDYDGLDVEGAALVVVRGEPQEDDPDSMFAGAQHSQYGDLRRKASVARDMGASALVVVENPLTGPADVLPKFPETFSAANFDIPVAVILPHQVNSFFENVTGETLRGVLAAIDEAGSPNSFALNADADIEIRVEKELTTGFNVVGVIPGSDPELAREYVVAGAHYDHLGIGGDGSMVPGEYGKVHPGADDNASGVAAVLELARWAAGLDEPLKRSLLICFFDGEELGLLGSTALMRKPPVPLEDIQCMVNFDMVGHVDNGGVVLGGVATSEGFSGILEAIDRHGLNLVVDAAGFGGSDYISFKREGIPVLNFFTGAHNDYSTPRDTWDKLNYEGIGSIIGLTEGIIAETANMPGRLEFVEGMDEVPSQSRNRGNLSVTMGTVPHYQDADVVGMGISDVVPGGPAEQAGLKANDVIVKINDKLIANIYDFMFVLQECVPGQEIDVLAVRDGEELLFKVTLAARNVER